MGTFAISPEEFLVRSAAADQGVDPDQAAKIAHTESGFNQNAVSPKGARGVMQLMPETAKSLGVDPNDLSQNIQGGVRYYKQLLERYGGDSRKPLAAYNAGPETVDSGKPLPKETQNYVSKIAGPELTISPEDFLKQSAAPSQPPQIAPVQPPVNLAPQNVPGMEALGGAPPAIAAAPVPPGLRNAPVAPPVPGRQAVFTAENPPPTAGQFGQESAFAPSRQQAEQFADPEFKALMREAWKGYTGEIPAGDTPAENVAAAIAKTAAGALSPESLATMLAAGGAAQAFRAAANAPRVAALLQNSPQVAKALDILANTAIPGAFTAQNLYGAGKSGLAAYQAAQKGDTANAIAQGTAAATNLLFAGLGAAGVKEAAASTAAAYPPAPTETAARPLRPIEQQLAEQTGITPTARASRPGIPPAEAAATAATLQQSGRNLAAQAWQQLAQGGLTEPIPIQIDGQPATIKPLGRGPKGRPFYQVLDATGKPIYGGNGPAVQDFLVSRGAAPAGTAAAPAGPSEAELDAAAATAWANDIRELGQRVVAAQQNLEQNGPNWTPEQRAAHTEALESNQAQLANEMSAFERETGRPITEALAPALTVSPEDFLAQAQAEGTATPPAATLGAQQEPHPAPAEITAPAEISVGQKFVLPTGNGAVTALLPGGKVRFEIETQSGTRSGTMPITAFQKMIAQVPQPKQEEETNVAPPVESGDHRNLGVEQPAEVAGRGEPASLQAPVLQGDEQGSVLRRGTERGAAIGGESEQQPGNKGEDTAGRVAQAKTGTTPPVSLPSPALPSERQAPTAAQLQGAAGTTSPEQSGQQTEDIITGTLNPPLTAKGKVDAESRAEDTANVDQIVAGPKDRTHQTAQAASKEAGVPVTTSKALQPWNLGGFQGKPQSQVDDQINHFIAHPDEVVPGGQSFNSYKAPLIGEIQKQVTDWKPGERVLNVTHSIGVQTVNAWIANGAPADKSISAEAMLNRQKLEPVALMRIDPRTMTMAPAENTSQDGIFIERHADTALDNIQPGEEAKGVAQAEQLKAEPQFAVSPEDFLADKPAEPEVHQYSSTQVQLPAKFADYARKAAAGIADSDLAEDGREDDPHITVKYGLHGEDAAPVKQVLQNEGPITAKIGKVSVFPAAEASAQRGGAQYDVVKLDVESPDLARLNKKIASLPHTDTHPVYQPHITLAYVKPGSGAKYAGKSAPGLTGQTVTFNAVEFRGHDGSATSIPLKGEVVETGAKTERSVESKESTAEKPVVKGGTPAEQPQRYALTEASSYDDIRNFWDALRTGDTIATPKGDLEVTRVTAFNMQPIMPTGPRGKWGAIGSATREVADIEAKLPDGEPQKFHTSTLHDFVTGTSKLEPEAPAEAPKVAQAHPAELKLGGNTYPNRFAIRKLGAKWAKKEQVWVLPDTPENRAAVAKLKGVTIQEEAKPAAPRIESIKSPELAAREDFPVGKRVVEVPSMREGTVFRETEPGSPRVWVRFDNGSELGIPAKHLRDAKTEAPTAAEAPKAAADYLSSRVLFNDRDRLEALQRRARNALTHTPANAWLEFNSLERALTEAREHLQKLSDAGESYKEGLAREIRRSALLLNAFNTQPQSKALEAAERDIHDGQKRESDYFINRITDFQERNYAAQYERYMMGEREEPEPRGSTWPDLPTDKAAEVRREIQKIFADGRWTPSAAQTPVGQQNEPTPETPSESHPAPTASTIKEEPRASAERTETPARAEAVELRPADREALEEEPPENVPGPRTIGTTPERSRERREPSNREHPAEHGEAPQPPVRPSERTGERELGVSERTGSASVGRDALEPARPEHRSSDGDYRITSEDRIGQGSTLSKARSNLAAIRLLKAIEARGTPATSEEQSQLVKYVGWGGMPQAFGYYGVPKEFEGIRDDLKELLTPEEYEAARASTPNAHYTSPEVVSSIWDAMRSIGLKSGARILEPSMGVGHFFGLMPDDLAAGSKRTGIELDSITGRIAKLLYPNANVHVAGFEKVPLPNNFFDLAISNVPFGNYGVADPAYRKNPALTRSIHNYFFAKALDKVRPGGVVAFITSSYTMDQKDPTIRDYLSGKADLLGSIRLPNTAFKGNAGTEVTTDVIFLRKLGSEEPALPREWIETAEAKGKDGVEVTINRYYAENPKMMLGEMTREGSMYAADTQTLEGTFTPEGFAKAAGNLRGKIAPAPEAQPERTVRSIAEVPDASTIKENALFEKDGKMWRRIGATAEPVDLSKEETSRVQGMIGVRNAVREVFRTQIEDAPAKEIAQARKTLNTEYDRFTKKFGPLNDKKNMRAYIGDPDAPLLLSLEDYDPETGTAAKADIFSKRTIESYKPVEKVGTAPEALLVSLNELGRLDLKRMASLTGKPEKELIEELGPLVYQNPEGEQWETADQYLSGNVREKLRMAEAAAKADKQYQRNAEALKEVQPKDLEPGEIDARLGASWIPKQDVERFMGDVLGLHDAKAGFATSIGTWTVNVLRRDTVANAKTFGTNRFYGDDLVSMALNAQIPTAYDTVKENGAEKRVVNEIETAAAREKQQELKDKFREWVWKEQERAERLSSLYNQVFNSTVERKYDGSHLTLPGASPGISLRPHQKNAIWRGVQSSGNTLLAHAVGAGKTWTMAGIAMEMRRLGLAKKPMFVVPNHLVEQWGSEFLRLYPSANLYVAGKEEFQGANRKRAMSRIATGNWDAVIVAHSTFGKLPVSDETFNEYVKSRIEALADYILEAKAERQDKRIVKELEKAKKRLEAKLEKRAKRESKDETVTFEQLGVDSLFVDEAHEFKNLGFETKRTRMRGLPNSDSDRANDLFLKSRYVSKLNNGKNVVFATGTPISNSIAEMYTMQRYLQMPYLESHGISHFDSWGNNFAEAVVAMALAPTGAGYRVETRFSRFVNVPELMSGFREVADILTPEMLKLPKPALKGGKNKVVVSPATPELKELVQKLEKRSQNLPTDPRIDNMLKITSEGRKAALDLRLVGIDQDRPDSKVNKAIDNIHRIWKDTAADKLTQLVFIDLSTPKKKGEGFSVYNDIRDKLISRGVPAKQIAFIHDADTDAKKLALFRDMNSGKVRILLGSTFKMGAGMNVQKRLYALHHVDVPWRPADLEQREGRILRQGNSNKEVEVYNYVTEGSFDGYMWQTVEAKAGAIGQVMRGDSSVRTVEDVDGRALTAAEIKAIASGNPLVLEKVKADAEINRLSRLKSAHDNQQFQIARELARIPGQIRAMEQMAKETRADIALRDRNQQEKFSATIQGKKYTDREDAGRALIKAAKDWAEAEEPVKIGEFRGFTLLTKKKPFEMGTQPIYLRGARTYEGSVSDSPAGSIASMEYPLRPGQLEGKLNDLTGGIDRESKKIADLEAERAKPFPHAARFSELQKKIQELNAKLDLNKSDKQAASQSAEAAEPEQAGEPDEAQAEAAEEARNELGRAGERGSFSNRPTENPFERAARLEKSIAMANVLDSIGATPAQAKAMTDEQWAMTAAAGEVQPPHSQDTKDEVVKQLQRIQRTRQRQALRLVSKERGSAPIITDLAQALRDRFKDKAPRANYSGLGAFERTFLPGRRLAEVEQASKPVFRAALRAASSEALASTTMRSAMPAIQKALEPSGHTWDELATYYVESRLLGLKERWENFANQAENATDEDLEKLISPEEDGSKSFFLDLMSKIEGRHGLAQDLGQTAAALADAKAWEGLRDFLTDTFHAAADRVASVMDPAWFESMRDAVENDPGVKEADRLYGDLIEKPMADNHALNEGIFSDALGPAGRYYPLIPVQKEIKQPIGRRLPYRAPQNQANAFATGLSESYDFAVDSFAKRLAYGIRGNDKASLIKTLQEERWAIPETSAYRDPETGVLAMVGPDGKEYRAVREETSPGRILYKDGKLIHVKARFAVMPVFVNRALRPILDRTPLDPDDTVAMMRWANMLATKGPLELVFHSSGVLGALYGNTPFLGESGLDKALSAPILKWFAIRGKLATIDPTTPENIQKLQEMAKAGALPAKSGKVTYSKKYAEMTGAKRERFSFGPLLYGPHGIDARARILMYDIWKAAYPNGTVEDLHHFVNQIGNYTPELQGEIEKFIKRIGVGPFATAGMTRIVNALQNFTGSGPGPGGTPAARLQWWLTASVIASLAVWIIAHKLLTGKYPLEDKTAKLFQIPVQPGHGMIGKYRHSKIGDALWGKGNTVGYLNFGFFDDPLALRGARAMGIGSTFEARQLGAKPGQLSETAEKDILNTFSGPMMGPAARAIFVGATGNEPYITGFRDYRTGRTGLQLLPAIPEKTKPGFATAGSRAWAAAKELNRFYTEGAENLGSLTGFNASTRPASRGEWVIRELMDLAAPGLVGNASNPYQRSNAIRQQQRAMGMR